MAAQLIVCHDKRDQNSINRQMSDIVGDQMSDSSKLN